MSHRVPHAFAALAFLVLARPALAWQAADTEAWIGKRVYTRDGAKSLDRVYTVTRSNGPWLWAEAEGSDAKGWVKPDRLVALDATVEYYTDLIRADPSSTSYYTSRGTAWLYRKEYDFAIGDYSEAVRLDPGNASAYNNRGLAWSSRKEYDKAIADYSEAIRLNPKNAVAYYARGFVWFAKVEYDKALADCAEAVRLSDWKTTESIYATFLGYFAARRAGRGDAAAKLLDEAEKKADKTTWPYPIIQFLRGEIDEEDLSARATDRDRETEVRCYLGFARLLQGRVDEARALLVWVRDRGTPDFYEIGMAAAELDRLDAARPPKP